MSLFDNFFDELEPENQKLIKAAFLIAGVYDLLPLLDTSYNIPLKLNEKSANVLSPMHQTIKAAKHIKFYVIAATDESPMFKQQAQLFNNKLSSSGLWSQFILVPKTDHFNVVENLTCDQYLLTKLIVETTK